MSSVAVFVDAGYLFAQGATVLTGSKKSRSLLKLNETAVVAELVSIAQARSGNARLLRIYWYDGGLSPRGLSLEHATLAHTDYIKLRLGFMNSQGQQKGVDSLIVTDLIEPARNHAISDAILLSGDEDVRIGVQIAQSFGVRVHLLGIVPSRGSQSLQLMQEADTTTEWDRGAVAKFLSQKLEAVPAASPVPSPQVTSPPPLESDEANKLEATVGALFAAMDSNEVAALLAFWTSERGLPREIDGRLLAQCRVAIGRNLNTAEKRRVRAHFALLVRRAGAEL